MTPDMEADERPTKIRRVEQSPRSLISFTAASNTVVPETNDPSMTAQQMSSADEQLGHDDHVASPYSPVAGVSEGTDNFADPSNELDEGEVPLPNSDDEKGGPIDNPKDSRSSSDQTPVADGAASTLDTTKPLSKNQQKKLRRQQEWEAGREERKLKRKEEIKRKRERKRAAKAEAASNGIPVSVAQPRSNRKAVQLPITFIFDCDFDDLMLDKEMKSLGSQLTRCYSDNKNARLRAHLAISSFGGRLKERFDIVLAKHYESWRGVRFFTEDFVEVAEKAKEWMKAKDGQELAGILQDKFQARQEQEIAEEEGEVIYLSSDSDNTLTELKPYSTYIIGGLVDRNRHKGICYKRAMDKGLKTAKLPIGEFLEMNSRSVLATNHVCEIMLKWLEMGDWGEAFMAVIPKRKGGVLRGANARLECSKDDPEDCNGDQDAMEDSDADRSEDMNGDKGSNGSAASQGRATRAVNGGCDEAVGLSAGADAGPQALRTLPETNARVEVADIGAEPSKDEGQPKQGSLDPPTGSPDAAHQQDQAIVLAPADRHDVEPPL